MIERRKTDTPELWVVANECCQREKDNLRSINARLKSINADLLAELEFTLRALTGQPHPEECRDARWLDRGIINARAAIAKAKGKD